MLRLVVAAEGMSANFAELDFQPTPLGDLSLRRRRLLSLGGEEIYEVKLGADYLMSSLFHVAEEAVSTLGLAALHPVEGPWDVIVGGLGLGYTARAALGFSAVRSLLVIDTLAAVIGWHQRGLVPLGPELCGDSRCQFLHGDFFALTRTGYDPGEPGRKFHAVLLDIDHSPRNLLHPQNGSFYEPAGLQALAAQLHPRGVFSLWSDDPPDSVFMTHLRQVFPAVQAHEVPFENPLLGRESVSTVYVAQLA